MRVVLGGGGSADEEAEVLSAFARLIPTPGRVLYLPIAAEQVDQNQQEYREWIELALGAYGDFDIDLWSSLSARKPSELNKFEAIFIGGGNTFNLLHQLRRYNFDQAIKAFVGQRKPIYGGSAGAIVLGHSISTASHYDQNYVGLADLSGLDLCHGADIWCHYSPDQASSVELYVRKSRQTVITIPETAGLLVTEEGYFTLGQSPIYKWTVDGRQTIPQHNGVI